MDAWACRAARGVPSNGGVMGGRALSIQRSADAVMHVAILREAHARRPQRSSLGQALRD